MLCNVALLNFFDDFALSFSRGVYVEIANKKNKKKIIWLTN